MIVRARFFALTALACLTALPVAAATPAQDDVAGRIVDAMGTRERIVATVATIAPQFASTALADIEANPEKRKQLDAAMARDPRGIEGFKASLAQEFTREMLARYPQYRAILAQSYRQRLNDAELATLLTFLSSPVGAKFITILPQAAQAAGAAGRGISGEAGNAAIAVALRRAGVAAPAIPPAPGAKAADASHR